ncbi:hypothetical protein GCM10025857_25920 [Alicyclobacillus contaminans]|nr:hypothetical protein GCM10025857_25920 [Alicyclobacillus contaminans]
MQCFCVRCETMQDHHAMHRIFATGFRRIGGYDVPLGVCANCRLQQVHAEKAG